MAAARAPAASLRFVSLINFFLVVLSHPGQSHLPLSAANAAMGALSYEELTTSLVVNQLAIVQMMQNVSDASCAVAEMGRQEARRADEAEEQVAKLEALQQAVETVEAGHERRLQEVLEAITNQISTTAQDTLASMAELREEIRLEMNRSLGAREPEQEATPTEAIPASLATIVHNDTQPSLCSGAKFLVGLMGSLEVVENGSYPSNTNCSWNITLPVKAPLSLTWEYIDMETHPTCSYDWVKVNDLSNGGASVFGAGLCGTLSPSMLKMLSVVLPPTKNILVSFRSDGSNEGGGFKLNYHVQTKRR
ncbi:uncharacterized protein LOC126991800 isoform X1 [Eriocheir sinensis]|uniref:uncharacterized protein LOC126991800 isoform X1 n=1 Tax=Eriocheir sinensis TaxID=95602 RepID=UPI0021CAD47F|nr:uncharacterized protein LOC126991800 isoform X1 [Eriocheir sinensis]